MQVITKSQQWKPHAAWCKDLNEHWLFFFEEALFKNKFQKCSIKQSTSSSSSTEENIVETAVKNDLIMSLPQSTSLASSVSLPSTSMSDNYYIMINHKWI